MNNMKKNLKTCINRLIIFWHKPIIPNKQLIIKNRIVDPSKQPIIELTAREGDIRANKITPCGDMEKPSYSVIINKPTAEAFLEQAEKATVTVLNITSYKKWDKDHNTILDECGNSENAILITSVKGQKK